MLQVMLICPAPALTNEVTALLRRVPHLEIASNQPSYPSSEELLRTIRVKGVHVLLLAVDDFPQAERLTTALDEAMPGFPVITLASREDPALLQKLLHLGVRDHLPSPIAGTALADALAAARRRVKQVSPADEKAGDLYTFFPARAGVGATTIATAVSAALANDFRVRTLLMDFDLEGGIIQFLLKLDQSASVLDLMRHLHSVDEGLWAQMVGRTGHLEILHAGRLDQVPQPDLGALREALSVARTRYQTVCVDLPSAMTPLTHALLQESKKIFLVATPEAVSLHMAAVRVRQLTDCGLQDRICPVLNRRPRTRFRREDVEAVLGLPIQYSVANDYAGVQQSVLDGTPSVLQGDLAQNIHRLAESMAPKQESGSQPSGKRKFLEFFHVSTGSPTGSGWMR
jgi:pilus assembly protein CpaE